jgi:stage V sporulation protein AF
MLGARDGFVETLVMNTALLRRRIRDERLTMEYRNIGGMSATDVVICYVKGVAKDSDVIAVREHILKINEGSLTLGTQNLAESMQKHGWLNPFPKFRTTERPDTAAAEVLEGKILIFCDTSPLVMILPSSIFDYLEEANDYYFPPLTGTYLRLIRTAILLFSLFLTPLWYLYIEYNAILPEFLKFLLPSDTGALPLAIQLFLCELAIDGLKIASMNTPSMLSNSLSVVGGLLLGDFAVSVGWLCTDVIFYMAFIAIANFAQQNRELGYAVKFCRMLLLGLTVLFGIYGFALGVVIILVLVATNRPLVGIAPYLYPLIPFDFKALFRVIFRKNK